MKNKIGYLLLSKNAQANKKEIETTTLPFTFTADGKRLYNYRIYGNTGGLATLTAPQTNILSPSRLTTALQIYHCLLRL